MIKRKTHQEYETIPFLKSGFGYKGYYFMACVTDNNNMKKMNIEVLRNFVDME